jgi:hypothetical protein
MSAHVNVLCDQTGETIPTGAGWHLIARAADQPYDFTNLEAVLDWTLEPETRARYPQDFIRGSDVVVIVLRDLASYRRTGEPIPAGLSVERYHDAMGVERTFVRLAHGEFVVTLEYHDKVAVGMFFDAHEVNAQ